MYTRIIYDQPALGVARITLNRPEKRNAQDPKMLYELDQALTDAGTDRDVRVVVLAANGPDFSSGHDISGDLTAQEIALPGSPIVYQGTPEGLTGAEAVYAFECEAYLGLCLRWRDFPKPVIAQVQGRVIAGGLMLVWPCDIIVAERNATFCDPVVAFGVNGHEYFVHPWEMGHRKAKEMLFTGRSITAAEALEVGMVNHVVDVSELESFTLDLAQTVASRPMIGLQLAKSSVNQAVDAQGQRNAVLAAFSLHQMGHANNLHRHGSVVSPDGAQVIRDDLKRGSRVD